ncbi:MAG: hypothetical protein IJ231_04140 [Clostridia bacterium]|nr:hypothetical protein [Clostridia bacterium]
MTDIHTHVVFGVDDGSRSLEMSQEMLREAAEAGVTEICCTSHCRPGHRDFPRQAYEEHLAQLRAFLWEEGLEITLHPGCEIMYTSEAAAAARTGAAPTLGGSGFVLLEFMPETPWGMMQHALREMGNAGLQVLVAHVERYACLRDEFSWLEEMKDLGATLQMNAQTVIRSQGFLGDRWARKALKAGMIDIVASDMHNLTSRKPNMGEAWKVLKKELGEDRARELVEETPHRILTSRVQRRRARRWQGRETGDR